MPIPPHRAGVIAILTAAGYVCADTLALPTYASGGTFSVVGGQGVNVSLTWWSAGDAEIAAKLAAMADVLKDEGLDVEQRGPNQLYVLYRWDG